MGANPASALVRDLAVLLLAGVLSLGALWLAGGPRLAPDSHRYLSAAQRINLDLPPVGQQRLAPGYTHSLAWLQRRGLEVDEGIQVVVLALYLLAAWGTWRGKGNRGEAWLVWGFLGMAMVVAGLTWVASDGRFLTRPLCCLVFLAGLGLERLLPAPRHGAPFSRPPLF